MFMARWHYEGDLGIFDYDDREFEFVDEDSEPYLAYVGEETDGSKIKIPEGIKVCNYMFMNSSIEIPPVIPKGVERCVSMFQDCSDLKSVPVIPEGVVDCKNMFRGCGALKKPPVIPGSVTDCSSMFLKCKSLVEAPAIPKGAKMCFSMFEGCESLKVAPVIPEGVTHCCSMFSNCKSLEKAPPVLPASVIADFSMFYGCERLERPPIFRCEAKDLSFMFYKCPFEEALFRWRTHEFSEEEQCALLAGETVTFEYSARSGEQVIRGRFDTYDNDGPAFGFVRTDVPKMVRRRLPDLPSEFEEQSQNDMSK